MLYGYNLIDCVETILNRQINVFEKEYEPPVSIHQERPTKIKTGMLSDCRGGEGGGRGKST